MTKIVNRKQGDAVTIETVQRLRKLAAMPDQCINTEDIPERSFTKTKQSAATKVQSVDRKAS